ncbi:MAG TPA: hypothetical protein PLS03_02240 [Terrimicrobiaceae bacterium]|nr:hypothetical protein [Terrimicrobiaceae bacterium]
MSKNGLRLLGILIAVVIVAAVAAVIGVSVWIQGYLRSEDFRKLVAAKTGEAFRSEAVYRPFRWSGASVFSDSLEATGDPGSIVQSLKADQVRAEVNWRAILDGAWRVDRIDVVNFQGTFRPGSPAAPDSGPSTQRPEPSGLKGMLPKRFELGQLNIADARIGFQAADARTLLVLDNSALLVRPDGAGWTIEGTGGNLAVDPLPVLTVTTFRSRIQGPVFFLTDARFQIGESGKLSAAGEFAAASKVSVEWNQVNIEPFLTPAWRSRLSGVVAGKADLSWPEAGPAAGQASGTFRLTEGLVQNIQVLEKVATFTGAPQFRRMPLQELSGQFVWKNGILALSSLILESKGLLRVEGVCTIAAGGAVDGTLRVGVTPQTLQWMPGSRERVFTTAQNGYLWTDVRIGGTVQNIEENLSARLANAMKDEVIQQGTRALEALPGPAREGAKGLLDALTPLIP